MPDPTRSELDPERIFEEHKQLILADSKVNQEKKQLWRRLDWKLGLFYTKSNPIVYEGPSMKKDDQAIAKASIEAEQDQANRNKEATVKQIVEAKINDSDMKSLFPFTIISVILIGLFVWALCVLIPTSSVPISKYWQAGAFALVAAISSMYEIRVKRVDEVIAQYKEPYPAVAAAMNRDPWVEVNRSKAVIAKYVSILTVFMAALLAILK
jgi:hypothetical protein